MVAKDFEGLREKPIRASALVKVKTVQSTSDFQFSNERVSHAGLCSWLEYGQNNFNVSTFMNDSALGVGIA